MVKTGTNSSTDPSNSTSDTPPTDVRKIKQFKKN